MNRPFGFTNYYVEIAILFVSFFVLLVLTWFVLSVVCNCNHRLLTRWKERKENQRFQIELVAQHERVRTNANKTSCFPRQSDTKEEQDDTNRTI